VNRRCLLLVQVALVSLAARVAIAQPYVPPATHRVDVLMDSNWRFLRSDATGAQTNGFDDSAWQTVTLPHTWNNLDGEDGGNNYYRGIGWYRTHYTVDAAYAGRRFFLKFDGSFYVTDVYINGTLLGQHQGGFAAFVFDATPFVNVGGDNVIAVKVSNAANANIAPLSADFTFFGGIYRDVHLLVTDPLHVSPLDYGSPGVYLQITNVSATSANLQVRTILSNAGPGSATMTVRAVITDAATNIVTALTNLVTLPAATVSNVVANTVIADPHLWNGLYDPYLYQTFVEIWNGATVLDSVAQPLGFRSFSVDPTNGFFLNGQHYDLHGVNMHQDWLNCGWALTNAQRATNLTFIKEIGATFLRLSHYEHDDDTYRLADQNGLVVWSEIPLINYITEAPAFYTNANQQLREMIRQRYNHPSVVCWSVFNEITLSSGPTPTNLIKQLVQLEALEDLTRPSTAAANSSDSDVSSLLPQTISFNKYFGWYSTPIHGIGGWADTIHANYPTRRVGVSEYGAGASIYHHSENPTQPGNTATFFHPEEWQNLVHETNWQLMQARPFLWCKLIWNMFDFAADGRAEGDTSGRNDKGLVTYDRQTRKDAFYYYKANWTTNPMVYITGHTFTNRLSNSITAKVYANCDSVELFLNGAALGARSSTNRIFNWPLSLPGGSNFVVAVGTKGSNNVTDSLFWNAPIVPPTAAILKPASSFVCLRSTNDTLLLSATATNAAPNPPALLVTTWTQTSGPGTVLFGTPTASNTTASFSAEGVYGLAFVASNGATTTVPLTVLVNPDLGVTNGLLAWWKMDESSGSTAADASGNGLDAAVSGGTFTTGYFSNALRFNGSGNAATFASPDTALITLAGWARADAQGNSLYPRIFDTPGYRLFFRFDSQGSNGLDFATYSTGNGDWFSGANTISTGTWYHVAARYDRSSLANLPALYVNGNRLALTTITSPSGTQPPYSGTGYIGNKSGLTRAWNGLIDDLRIYNRLLTDSEIAALASLPPTNVAPVVQAGTNQAILFPAPASVNATVSDDGKPTPVTITWSAVNGPGTVSFANPHSLSTSATFSAGGLYLLRLTADDGQVQTSSDLTVSVITRPTISAALQGSTLKLSWQTTGGNWQLQCQTNNNDNGLTTNWKYVSGVITNPFVLPLDHSARSVFCRLVLTNF
jgi:beta-galactosidase